MLPEFSLEGRTAIVTGGGRGIGRAIALVLAEAGADVVVTARTQSEIAQTAKEVEALGRRALALQADVSSSSQVDSMVERALDEFGRIDILVNNAGKLLRMPVVPLPDQDLAPPLVSGDSSAGTTD
ncbi:MAG: SDR family NAD(P)-dependent oxidoreductase, partial [Chloroflexi bacterium]|nr:SDR family NAD(P)-dependent oxidoreductase [Chloroflexota bacterium]